MRILTDPAFVPSEEDYWAAHACRGLPLKPLGKPCHDCAVEWGLYAELSDNLALQQPDIIAAVSERWFCHNHPNRACAGNIERLAQGIEARCSTVGESPVPNGDAPHLGQMHGRGA